MLWISRDFTNSLREYKKNKLKEFLLTKNILTVENIGKYLQQISEKKEELKPKIISKKKKLGFGKLLTLYFG